MTAVWSADDLCVRVDRGERQDAKCERHRDRTFRKKYFTAFFSIFQHRSAIAGDEQRRDNSRIPNLTITRDKLR